MAHPKFTPAQQLYAALGVPHELIDGDRPTRAKSKQIAQRRAASKAARKARRINRSVA